MATEASPVVWRRSMRDSMTAEAVTRDRWPKERREERYLWSGGVEESCVVARRRQAAWGLDKGFSATLL